MCQLVNEMKERDISLDDILKELHVILGQSEYVGLLMCAGDTTYNTDSQLTLVIPKRRRPSIQHLTRIQLGSYSQKKS